MIGEKVIDEKVIGSVGSVGSVGGEGGQGGQGKINPKSKIQNRLIGD